MATDNETLKYNGNSQWPSRLRQTPSREGVAGFDSLESAVHVFGKDGPSFMVLPTAIDLQITAGKSFPHKPATPRQSDGSVIFRLNIGFQTVKFELLKSVFQNEQHAFAHQTLPGVGGKSIITKKRALQGAVNDVVQVDGPCQIARFTKNNQKAPMGIGNHAPGIIFKFFAGVRR